MFKRIFTILSLLAFGASAVPAAAGGWPDEGHGSIKDSAPDAFSWTGFYVGGHAGLATGDTSGGIVDAPSFLSTDYNLEGALYGAHAGYNYQMGQTVLGIEGTYSGSDIDGKTSCVFNLFSCQRELDWLATIEGRLGYAFGPTMVYARGGVAWGELETTNDFFIPGLLTTTGSETHTGWTAGFGIEHALGKNVVARIEYAHIDLGEESTPQTVSIFGSPVGTIPTEVDAEIDTIKVGLSFKFGH